MRIQRAGLAARSTASSEVVYSNGPASMNVAAFRERSPADEAVPCGLLLRSLLDTAEIGVAFFDTELRCLRHNEAMAALGLVPTDGSGAKAAWRIAHRHLRRVIATGLPITDDELLAPRSSSNGAAAPHSQRHWEVAFHPVRDGRLSGKVVAAAMIATDVTERRRAEAERAALAAQAEAEAAGLRQCLLREMLCSLTGGRLVLCGTVDDLPAPLSLSTDRVPLSRFSLRHLRSDVRSCTQALGFPPDRWQDLEHAAGEAALNAVVHATGAEAVLRYAEDGEVVQVWIHDRGPGIPWQILHRALLERGYTTRGTMGQGFWVTLQTADRTFLLTGPGGTTVVLEMHREAPKPPWFDGM